MSWQDELKKVTEAVRGLSSLPESALKSCESGIQAVIEDQFSQGSDAYGNSWPELKTGNAAHLGDLRDSVSVSADGARISVEIDDVFRFHQGGTTRMPERSIFPREDLPESYRGVIENAIEDQLEDLRNAVK